MRKVVLKQVNIANELDNAHLTFSSALWASFHRYRRFKYISSIALW